MFCQTYSRISGVVDNTENMDRFKSTVNEDNWLNLDQTYNDGKITGKCTLHIDFTVNGFPYEIEEC